ncbi:MAG: hypothetical protein KGK07_04395 [Chloroflexota bacterium]|nr:hypothetical protein [Chloroflexota bacterium]
MKRRWWLAAVGGAALVVVVGAGVVMAQTPTPGAGTATSFLDRVAQKLGITTPKLQSAINSAANDQIDAMVKSGKLTQQQADQLKQAIAQGRGPGLGGPFFDHGFGPGMHGPKGFGMGPLGPEMGKLASFLGISASQLRTELQASNATLATVAQAHGKSRTDLKNFITSEAKTRLDEAVKDGKLTQQQETSMLSLLSSNVDAIIDGKLPLSGPGAFGPGIPGVEMGKLASFLGISTSQLRTELQASNATLATVAQAHGKSRTDLKNFITSEAKTQLDQAVKAGKLTQQQETSMLSLLSSNLDALIDGKLPLWGPGGRGMMPGMPFFGREGPEQPETPETPGTPATPGTGARYDIPAPAGSAMSVLESS